MKILSRRLNRCKKLSKIFLKNIKNNLELLQLKLKKIKKRDDKIYYYKNIRLNINLMIIQKLSFFFFFFFLKIFIYIFICLICYLILKF